jgi:hypothetical protein
MIRLLFIVIFMEYQYLKTAQTYYEDLSIVKAEIFIACVI